MPEVAAAPNTMLILPSEFEFDRGNQVLADRIEAALTHPLSRTFRDSLDRLQRIAKNRPGARVKLYLDFAPLSFAFVVILPDGSSWLHGGLIFHGSHDGGGDGGGPTFSVNVTPMDGWTIHT